MNCRVAAEKSLCEDDMLRAVARLPMDRCEGCLLLLKIAALRSQCAGGGAILASPRGSHLYLRDQLLGEYIDQQLEGREWPRPQIMKIRGLKARTRMSLTVTMILRSPSILTLA